MRLLDFENWNNVTERERVYINPFEVSSLRECRDRRAYGGFNEVTEISMKNGDKYVVHGHVAKKISEHLALPPYEA